jgi:hypothetical protein
MKRKRRHYLTGIEALNYHGNDWHLTSIDLNYEYPEEVRTWAGDFGVTKEKNREVANPIRAFLDYLFYVLRYMKHVPVIRFDDLVFSEEKEKEISKQIERLLIPVLTTEEKWLLEKWKKYNKGGEYEFINFKQTESKTEGRRKRKIGFDVNDFRNYLGKAFNL